LSLSAPIGIFVPNIGVRKVVGVGLILENMLARTGDYAIVIRHLDDHVLPAKTGGGSGGDGSPAHAVGVVRAVDGCELQQRRHHIDIAHDAPDGRTGQDAAGRETHVLNCTHTHLIHGGLGRPIVREHDDDRRVEHGALRQKVEQDSQGLVYPRDGCDTRLVTLTAH
jgi:hypothetical protein